MREENAGRGSSRAPNAPDGSRQSTTPHENDPRRRSRLSRARGGEDSSIVRTVSRRRAIVGANRGTRERGRRVAREGRRRKPRRAAEKRRRVPHEGCRSEWRRSEGRGSEGRRSEGRRDGKRSRIGPSSSERNTHGAVRSQDVSKTLRIGCERGREGERCRIRVRVRVRFRERERVAADARAVDEYRLGTVAATTRVEIQSQGRRESRGDAE